MTKDKKDAQEHKNSFDFFVQKCLLLLKYIIKNIKYKFRTMKKKKDNNLIMMTIDGKNYYFTSMNRAGLAVGLAAASVKWAINYGSELITNNDKKVTFKIVDGSEIAYKYING